MKLGETCANCGLKCDKSLQTKDEGGKTTGYADPCLGILPGVKYGCCGHGRHQGYLFFQNGRTLRFELEVSEQYLLNVHHKFNDGTTIPRI